MSCRKPPQERIAKVSSEGRSAWLQSRRMKRETSQQSVISAAFEASNAALDSFTHHLPDLDRDRMEYALASVLLEEAWVTER